MSFKLNLSLFLLIYAGSSLLGQPTYTNPIAAGLYMGDPYILLHDEVYYLYGTTSSGEGFKCWSSENMNDWNFEGYAYKKTEQSWGDGNFWAPEVYFYEDEFYLAYSCKGKDTFNNRMLLCLAKSSSPTGPFQDVYAPWFDLGFSCIDAHLFFDDDRKIYLYFDRVGYEGNWPKGHLYGYIYCMEVNEILVPSGDTIFCSKAEQEWENPLGTYSRCNEGCFVLRNNNIYYMTYSANHYADPFYGIGYSIALSPLGPWTKNPDNPLIGMDREAGIFGPGHNCFTTSPDGSELFIVYHTHFSEENKRRQVNIDRVYFDQENKLMIMGPTKTPQILPAGIY